jgi:hypothetical protein
VIKIPVEGFPRQACPRCGNPMPKIDSTIVHVLCCMVKYDVAHEPVQNTLVWREIASYAKR